MVYYNCLRGFFDRKLVIDVEYCGKIFCDVVRLIVDKELEYG